MLKLKHLQLEGFRGFPMNSGLIEFSTPAVLFYGDNHQGKSSMLNAIEWCLYGDRCIGSKSGIRERIGWEVVNRNSSLAQVEIAIETDEGIYTIHRSEAKGKGKRGKKVKITLPDGLEKVGDEAEQEIVQLVGLSFRDFATTVYQHQETIRDIVIQTPKDRNDAIDRLLGLSDFRNILTGIRKSKIQDIKKDIEGRRDELAGRIEQAYELRQNDFSKKKQDALESGLSESELTETKLFEGIKEINEQIQEFATVMGVQNIPIEIPANWSEFPEFEEKLQNELDRLWSESPDILEQSDLNSKRTKADALKINYRECKTAVEKAVTELNNFIDENGDQTKISDGIQRKEIEIAEVENDISAVSPKARLIDEGLKILRENTPSISIDECPLCGETVPNLLDHLNKKWSDEFNAQIQELNNSKSELEESKSALKDCKEILLQFEKKAESTNKILTESTMEIVEFLGRPLSNQDDPVGLLNLEITRASDRLQAIESAIRGKRDALNTISSSIKPLQLLFEIIEFEEKIKEIEQVKQTPEYEELETLINDVAEIVVDIQRTDDFIRECIRESAENRMAGAKTAIDDYFQRIVGNPGIKKLTVTIEENRRTGGNSYSFCDIDGRELNPVLSQGDLNGLALSMFMGLVEAYDNPINFMMMDDPSQSLGSEQKKRLVDVLDAVCQSGRSVVVATMDSEVRGYLEQNLTKNKTVYEIANWEPEAGPSVSKG